MIAVMIDYNLEDWIPEIRYAFDFLFQTLGYEYKFIQKMGELKSHDIFLCYAINEPTEQEIEFLAKERVTFFLKADPDLVNIRMMKSKYIKDIIQEIDFEGKIPVLCPRPLQNPIQKIQVEGLYFGKFNFDIIGNIFFSLTAYHERNERKKDDYGRFPDSEYIFKKYEGNPYINKLCLFFEAFLMDGVVSHPDIFLIKKDIWPKGESKATVVNYFMDSLQKWSSGEFIWELFKNILLLFYFSKSIPALGRIFKYMFTNEEPYWNFELIAEAAARYKTKGTFFFGIDEISDQDEFRYSIYDKLLLQDIKELVRTGNEIGLIGSSESLHRDNLRNEVRKLENTTKIKVYGVQQNNHNYRHDLTSKAMHKAELIFDSSWGFIERNGFKYGIAIPFQPYLLTDRKPSKFLEIPQNFNDTTLWFDKKSFVEFDSVKSEIKNLTHQTASCYGIMNYQFTNSNFTEISYLKMLFQYVNEIEKGSDVFRATLSQIAKWWNKRKNIQITEENNTFTVYCPEYVEHFTVTIKGEFYIEPLSEVPFGSIKGKKIFFAKIEADTKLKFRLISINKDIEERIENSNNNKFS